MKEKEGMISVSAEAENGTGELVIEISEDALQALGAEPGDKLVWRVEEDGRAILNERDQPEDQRPEITPWRRVQ